MSFNFGYGRIIKHYSLEFHQHSIPNIHIEGYNANFLPALLNLLEYDFMNNKQLMNETLDLFSNDNSEIFGFIDKAAGKCISFLSSIHFRTS